MPNLTSDSKFLNYFKKLIIPSCIIGVGAGLLIASPFISEDVDFLYISTIIGGLAVIGSGVIIIGVQLSNITQDQAIESIFEVKQNSPVSFINDPQDVVADLTLPEDRADETPSPITAKP